MSLKLEIGKKYLMKNGGVAEVLGILKHFNYSSSVTVAHLDTNYIFYYSPEGICNISPDPEDYDIVKQIEE